MAKVALSELESLAQRFVASLPQRGGAGVIALYGDLGAGKTAFVKAAAKALGIGETVTSPTFVIEKIYALEHQAFTRLVHIDAYRLESAEELRVLGFETLRAHPNNLIFIEWADRVEELLPQDTTRIHFSVLDETVREITIEYGSEAKK